jgi:hypothetical protein
VDPVRIEVRDGERISTVHAATGVPLDPVIAAGHPTVEELFDIIPEAIRQRVARLEVRYHEVLGYPLDVAIDYDRNVIDEEVTYRVLELAAR